MAKSRPHSAVSHVAKSKNDDGQGPPHKRTVGYKKGQVLHLLQQFQFIFRYTLFSHSFTRGFSAVIL